jgi:hypothetical protein
MVLPVQRNMAMEISRIYPQGAGSSGMPLQGASNTSKPVEGERHVVPEVGRLHLAMIRLSQCLEVAK